jgi:enamine deaminase RidA (YjgF/YER057c/UK114 family)
MRETSSNSQDLSIQFYATSCRNLTPIVIGDRLIGYSFEDDYARYCILRNVGASDARGSRVDQATQTWDILEEGLNMANMRLNDLVRTWLYADEILDWYGDFNSVRNGLFNKHKIYDGVVPASTGIGIRNAGGLALVAGAYAVRPKDASVTIRPIPSPLQCPALEYGSSFSRAVEIGSSAGRLLMISGTASIKPGGETAHVGDIEGQISLTMDVVGAILNSRSMDWSSVSRATAYFKHIADMPRFTEYLQSANITGLPLACTTADICRDDLLFEIELDAYSQDTSPR